MTNQVIREHQVNGLHVVEAGPEAGPAVVLLHGWPQSSRAWREVQLLAAAEGVRTVAPDLPGIGGSAGVRTSGAKAEIAAVVHELVQTLGAKPLLVGMDAGGMVAYPYLRSYPDSVSGVVIADVVVPGIDPWAEVLANPYIWHFGFHAVPGLPETVVTGHEEEYFGYFYEAISSDGAKIPAEARAAYVAAYRQPGALAAGFDWYRAFRADAEHNVAAAEGPPVTTPLLYLRGDQEGGDLERYRKGLEGSGVAEVRAGRIAGSGHFSAEEAPQALWEHLRDFREELLGQ